MHSRYLRIAFVLIPCAVAMLFVGVPAHANGLSALDTNHDGSIGRQEALSAQVEAFHRLDTDGNDVLSRAELTAAKEASEETASNDDAKKAREHARERWFGNLDTDGDDVISLSEYQAGMTPYFDRLDADGNGAIDASELRAAFPERPQTDAGQ